MRVRLSAPAIFALAAAACASEGFPPGGPEDLQAPVLVESDPADRSVNAKADQSIRLKFDEVIDDRQLRELARLIRVNPDEPEFEHILDDDTVILRAREPMLDGVTYAVTIMPGLRDRGGNGTTQARTVLFSVGGEEPITLSIVRATIVRDTTPVALALYRLENQAVDFGYTMVADSEGQVTMEGVAYGEYVATAWEERVRPAGWQETEEPGARDTFALGPANRSHDATYRVLVRDTTPPSVRRIETPHSGVVQLVFDDSLAGDGPPPASAVRLWEAAPGISGRDVPTDSLPLEEVRGRRLALVEVRRAAPLMLEIVPVVPLQTGKVYRVEISGLENRAGVATREGEGSTFRAEFEGPRRFRSEPIPWSPGPP
jgi:hypothetical protein